MRVNEHRITIEAPASKVFKEIVIWGESSWWPKRSFMKFTNLSSKIELGTIYLQKVLLPFAPCWHAQIVALEEPKYIKRAFLDGIFNGFEVVELAQDSGSCEVVYRMKYHLRGTVSTFMWKLIFRRLHNKNIVTILKNLKQYLEQCT